MFKRIVAAALIALASLSLAAAPAFAAETTITVTDVTTAGVNAAGAAANADGSKFVVGSDERVFLRVANTNAATRDVTLVAQRTSVRVPGVGVVTVADKVITVAANTGDVLIGPITPAYVDSSGYAHVTFDAVADLTIKAFRLPASAQ